MNALILVNGVIIMICVLMKVRDVMKIFTCGVNQLDVVLPNEECCCAHAQCSLWYRDVVY